MCLPLWIYGWLRKFNEISLPENKTFYSHLNMENTADEDYASAKWVCENFEIINLKQYHGFYV